jgi:translation initiation factor IF-2
MKSKLLLTLWLIGGVLYAGSTIFLAHAVLGGAGASGKRTALAVATETQCAKDDVANKDAATKTASVDPAKPVPTPAPQKPAADASRSVAPQPDAAADNDNQVQDDQAQGDDSQGDDSQGDDSQGDDSQADAAPDAMTGEGAGPPGDDRASLEDWPGREAPLPGAGEQGPETEEWAAVVAGTADMRSEPDLRSPMIYALPSGWHVRVISRQPGWVQVQDAHSGAAGWVEASALAPSDGPGARPGYGSYRPGYGDPYGPPPRYADEGPYPWQAPRRRAGEFGDFLRRALGGF